MIVYRSALIPTNIPALKNFWLPAWKQGQWTYVDSTFIFNQKYNIGSSSLNRHNFVRVVSTLICDRWKNEDKHTSARLSFSTKYQRWSNIGSLTLNRHISMHIVSLLFCQRWNNIDELRSTLLGTISWSRDQ